MPADRASKDVVQSLAKGFRVLEVFDDHAPDLTVSEIARKAGLDAGTAYRLAKTLVMLGYLRQIEKTKRYTLTLKVLDLGFHAIGRQDFRTMARPYLRALVGETSEAASVGVLSGSDVVFIERSHAGLARLGVDVKVGSHLPAYCTAIGQSILAYLEPSQRLQILKSREIKPITVKTPRTIEALEQRFARIRRLGYAVSDEETVPGVRVAAVPILDVDGHPYGALSVTAPAMRAPLKDFLAKSVGPLQEAAGQLGRAMRITGCSAGSAVA